MAMPASELRTLGAFAFTIDGRAVARPSTQKARALLAFLAMRRGERIARDAIVETFWPESDPENARQSLKTALWSIRRSIRDAGAAPDGMLAADNFTVCWLAQTRVDACEFERRARAGETAALELYTGDFLPGDYDVWASAQREQFINQLEALLIRALEGEDGVASAQRLLQLDPFNEAAYATLIDAELKAGRMVAARTLLARFRQVLRENGLAASEPFERRFAALNAAPKTDALHRRFIGRARELALFERTLRDERPSTILVHADAGFGKTALLDQFRRRAADAGRTTVSFTVRQEAHGFGGWEEIYRERTGRPFEELVVERGASLASATAAAILQTLAPGSYIFVDEARHLHGDSAFVTSAVVAKARDCGISLVFATRPEGVRNVLAMVHGETIDMPLAGLSEDEIAAALADRGREAREFAQLLHARTHGHPLFLQRILERGQRPDKELYLPASVRALIDARLHERGEDAFSVAALLALDPQFESQELAQILQWPEERVLDGIDDLLALGIVCESEGATNLAFAHELVMEVARDSLSPQRRRKLHRMAAAFLEGSTVLTEMERCAAHHAASGEALRAAELHLRCAEAAYSRFEPRNAAMLAERAREELLALDRTPEIERLALRADAAQIKAFSAASDTRKAEEVARAAIGAAERFGDSRMLFDLVLLRMRARMRTSDLESIEEDARRAMQLAEQLDDRGCYAEACLGLLQTAMQRVDKAAAMKYGPLAFEAALESRDADLAIFVASEYIHAQAAFWRIAEGMQTLRRTDELLASGTGLTEPSLHYSASMLMYQTERYDAARDRIALALRLHESRRVHSGRFVPDRQRAIAILTHMRGLIAVACGDWETACSAYDAFAASPAAQTPGIYPHVVALGVRALLGRSAPGDLERASALLATLDRTALVDDTKMYAACAAARIAARRGDPDAARLLGEALAITQETAQGAGLDADRVFAEIAAAARECGALEHARRADELHRCYYELRRTAAGAYWGGQAVSAI
jgi:DNA-binding SARP family transcriptional activator